MRILYISHLYHPEPGAQPVRVSQLSRHLSAMGHDVTVLTGVPNHPAGSIYPGHRLRALQGTYSEMDGAVRVVRVAYGVRPNRGAVNRLVAFTTFTAAAGLRSLFMGPFDVVIGTIPQPIAPLAAWFRSFAGRARFVLEVRDLWPEGIPATGQGDERSLSYRGVDAIVGFLYRRADRVISVTRGIKDILVETRGFDADDIDVVRAGVDPSDLVTDDSREQAKVKLGLTGRFVATYSGTVGNAHGLGWLVEAAQLLKESDPDVRILIVGSGAEEELLHNRVSALNLDNVCLIGQRPRAELPDILAASDIGLALLRPAAVFRTVFPTKIYEYMAAGLPVLTNVPGETEQIVAESGAGITVAAGDATAIANGVRQLMANRQTMKAMSASGRKHAMEMASWRGRAEQFEQALLKAVRS